MLTILSTLPFPTKIVGGWVRNNLLNVPQTDDLDLATEALPHEIIGWGKENNILVIPTGLQHGTVTLLWKEKAIEITTLRRDVQTNGRHAIVEFSKDWEQDAKRRDFTINALYRNAQGEIEDYVGGLLDIEKRKVIFVGDADQRIREDYLRIWRYYRFLALYGDFNYHESFSLKTYQEGLHSLSKERIHKELIKWLEAPITKTSYAKELFHVQFNYDMDYALEEFETSAPSFSFVSKKTLSLFKICLLFQENIPDLSWSNEEKRYFKAFFQAIKEKNAQYVLQKFGHDIALSYALFHNQPLEPLEIFPLRGGDLKDIIPSHQISSTLEQILRWWSEQPSPRPSKEGCLMFVLKKS